MAHVVVYSKAWCPFCRRALSLLSDKLDESQLTVIDIDQQPAQRDEMIARSGRQTVPQIFIGERHVGGCDDLFALAARGELDALLQQAD